MAWTNVGFDGTINEAQWSQMAGLLGNGYVAAGNGDCVVTAVPGARSVSVAAGSLYGDGVVSTNSGPETVAMTTPVNGQWYVIALRRTWATNTAALVAIAGATTTTTTPTAPPTSFPTLNTNVGVLTDQPIAWAWCNSANTTVVVYDIRLKAVKSMPPVVANQNERDAKFMTPTQGLQVWRDDLGVVETYLGLYNASTNPGGGDVAGWTSTPRQYGLVPIQPTSVVIASGTGSANALGKITFSGATAVSLNGVFTNAYSNYKIIYRNSTRSNSTFDYFRLRGGGSDVSTATYDWVKVFANTGSGPNRSQGAPVAQVELGYAATNDRSSAHIEMFNPATAEQTWGNWQFGNYGGSIETGIGSFRNYNNTSYDGFSLFPSGGNFTGYIQVFGYND